MSGRRVGLLTTSFFASLWVNTGLLMTSFPWGLEKKMGPDDEVKAVETVEDTSEWEEIEVDVDRPVYERVQRVDRDEPSVTDTSDSMPPTLEAEIVPESKLDVEIMCELGCQRAEGDATSPSARDDISIVAVWCSARSDSESESESEGERPGYGCAARRVEVGDQEEKVEKGLVEDYGYLVHLL